MATDFDDYKEYPVIWAAMGNRKKIRKIVGICGKDWAPAFSTQNSLVAIVVKDVKVDFRGCQDEDRCMNLKCPHNKTTPETLIAARPMFRHPNTQKILKGEWPLFVQKFNEAHTELAAYCKKVYEADGKAGIIFIDWKRKPSEREKVPFDE
jgi:hypothetical protein